MRESARLHAKLECAGETDLPHVVSDNFSKPGKLLEAGRPPPPAVSPCADSGWGRSFASLSCRMHWCRCMVTPAWSPNMLFWAEDGLVVYILVMKKPSSSLAQSGAFVASACHQLTR